MKIVTVVKDAAYRENLEKLLRKLGQEYKSAETVCGGQEGYNLIKEEVPDLIIADISLSRMGGLVMLKKLRREKIHSRVILLAEKEDLRQIRQALELGVEGYFIKPVQMAQLEKRILQIEQRVDREYVTEAVFTVENILMGCMNGQLHPEDRLHNITKRRFGFTVYEPGAVFAIWLDEKYNEEKEAAGNLLEQEEALKSGSASQVFEVGTWNLLFVVLYGPEAEKYGDAYFQEKVVPKLCTALRGTVVCIRARAERLVDLQEVLGRMYAILDWNLLFDRGELICMEKIEGMEIMPMRYPVHIESRLKNAITAKNGEEVKQCYYQLYDYLRRKPYSPRDMKECIIRFNMVLLNVYKIRREVESEVEVQRCMQMISTAVSWRQIRRAVERFMQALSFDAIEEEFDRSLSPLVYKAVQLVRKYYDQGITLEEIAAHLFVSEEYLSTQFKKETGFGFVETVRKYRIDRIKGLLLGTKLKLNQIAELTGYADSKYMSRVFKDEVGMLPTEFRKKFH
ncbi:MAG TPA: response regulator [Candidatus Mediterraneibacter pullicola]|uniref:Stage 0 sporulation protein A homolog n=1 Tax=Candidatus Mediterraneibacter pullicola TaxID=2838682 RepID=A0A9D2HC33_9FIRM|nr:response regulator [Candidatus Mediterraneibacter pullicola]